MKKILIAILAVVALESCSNEETVMEAPKQAIEFGNVFVDNATRADYSDGVQKLTSFNVYGILTGTAGIVNIFDGDEVTGSVGTGVWTYVDADTKAEYWIPGADYDFAAVVDAIVETKDTNGMPLTLTTVPDANSNLEDMLYATAHVEDAIATQGAVDFTFSHLLSKAKFTVTSNAQDDYYHTVKDITVANYSSGTYTIAKDGEGNDISTWASDSEDAKNVPFSDITQVTSASAKYNAEMLLVPNAATFNVTFTVELWNSKGTVETADDVKLSTEPKSIPVTIEDDETLVGIQKGHAYNFTIACSVGNPIQFSVTNDPTWSDGGNVNIQ